MVTPTFKQERRLWAQGYRFVAGVDEVGRGSWAGPLVAAAVIFPPPRENLSKRSDLRKVGPLKWRDSKLLTPRQREALVPLIKKTVLAWAIGTVSVKFINTHGLTRATEAALLKALKKLKIAPDFHLIDYFTLKALPPEKQRGIKHGDTLVASIAAASVIAKVYRDNLMLKLHRKHPHYGWDKNKGYGTWFHQKSLRQHGLCPLHRLNFLPPDLDKPRPF